MHTITPLISAEELQGICKRLWQQLSIDYEGKNPLLIGILNGCNPFLSDLKKNITIPVDTTYMKVRSYVGTVSSGNIQVEQDVDIPVKWREVIIVEDIVDTGMTMDKVCSLLQDRQVKSLKIVSLLDKPDRRIVKIIADYIGKEILDLFVVGYGMDYEGLYRELLYVGILNIEASEEWTAS